MTNRVAQHVVAGLLTALSAAACAKTPEQKQTDDAKKHIEEGAKALQQGADAMAKTAQQSSQQMAQGLQQMSQGFKLLAQSGTKPVEYEQLKALLPDVTGWTESDAKGEQLTMPVSYSRAEARYRQDDRQVTLEITDTALNAMLIAPWSMFVTAGFSERSDEGFKRATKISGQPGAEEWNGDSDRGEVFAIVNNRFIVHAMGHHVAVIDPVRALVERVDMTRLAALR